MKYFTFTIVLASIIFASISAEDQSTSKVEVQVVKDINEFKKANPELQLIELNFSSKRISPRLSQTIYSLGSRVSGDRLVAADDGWAVYPNKQNLKLTIWYPASGNGALVTFVQVVVTQDTGTSGTGYIVDGGIGKRYIQVVIEAWNTAYIDYSYKI